MWRTFLRNRTSVAGATLALAMILIAILAPWIAPYDPLTQNVYYRFTPPEASHLLGTDFYGRDILSRVLWGARVSLLVGTSAVLLGMITGMILGMIAAYKGGKIEMAIMRAVDVMMSFPDEVFGIMVMPILNSAKCENRF